MLSKTHVTNLGARVRRGARWLDKAVPGWETMLDPAKLEMSNADTCMLGQVYKSDDEEIPNFDAGLDLLYKEKGTVEKPGYMLDSYYGFDLSPDEDDNLSYEDTQHCWSVLTEKWIYEAKKRIG